MNYGEFLKDIKQRIQTAQVRASLAVNRELVTLYWEIGKSIVERQKKEGWGTKIIEQLSVDLRGSFPGVKGFSSRNLKYMRAFAEVWGDKAIVQQLAAQIPWSHNCVLLDKVKNYDRRRWYIQKTIEHGWSRSILVHQIESKLYDRQAVADKSTNFSLTLPKPDSDLAHELIKSPYNFDFLTLGENYKEQELQRGLITHLRQFLLELGVGFAFVGENYHLEVGGDDFYMDLLFYHLTLRCYIVIELKAQAFKPEYTGKLNFYLSAVDDLLRHPDDKPTIGLLLCKDKNHITAEYSLKGMKQAMGISTFETTKGLPKDLLANLPSIEQLESKLNLPLIEDDVPRD